MTNLPGEILKNYADLHDKSDHFRTFIRETSNF